MKKIIVAVGMILVINAIHTSVVPEKILQDSPPLLPSRLQDKVGMKVNSLPLPTYEPVMDSQHTTLLVGEALKSLGQFIDGDLRITPENKQILSQALEVVYLFAALKSGLSFKENLEELFDRALNEFEMHLIALYLASTAEIV